MEKTSKAGAGQRISDFVQRNRKPIFIGLSAVAVAFIGTIVTLFLMDTFKKRAISELEELRERYHTLSLNFADEPASGESRELLHDLGAFARRSSGFVSGSAWAMIARIHSERGEWPQAEAAWRNAAAAASRTYLGPLALFNAAVAAEERGDIAGAIELFAMSVSHNEPFPGAAHAQFSIGRLNETQNNRAGAIEAYRVVLARWPGVLVWANLAQSRIIALETGGQ